MRKKADFASIVFAVILLFVIAVVFFFIQHFNDLIYTELQASFNTTVGGATNYSEAVNVLTEVREIDRVVWDYAFLAIFMGIFIVLGLTAYAVRISPIFYWIYGIMSLTVLATGVMLSNIWQDMINDPEFAVTLTRFTITNTVLSSYYPMIVVAIIMLAMILLFGKPAGQGGRQ